MTTGNAFHLTKTFENFETGTNQVNKFPGKSFLKIRKLLNFRKANDSTENSENQMKRIFWSNFPNIWRYTSPKSRLQILQFRVRLLDLPKFSRPRREPFWREGFSSQSCPLSRKFGKLFATPSSFAEKSIPTKFYSRWRRYYLPEVACTHPVSV